MKQRDFRNENGTRYRRKGDALLVMKAKKQLAVGIFKRDDNWVVTVFIGFTCHEMDVQPDHHLGRRITAVMAYHSVMDWMMAEIIKAEGYQRRYPKCALPLIKAG